jgi:hypothetical protein
MWAAVRTHSGDAMDTTNAHGMGARAAVVVFNCKKQ